MMNSYYLVYLLLQKIYNEKIRTHGNLTVYKANDWEDDFGKKFSSNLIFKEIKFLETRNLVNVTHFRECSTCKITSEGSLAYENFEKSEQYKTYLTEIAVLKFKENTIPAFFDKKNKEHHDQEQMAKLNEACISFFEVL